MQLNQIAKPATNEMNHLQPIPSVQRSFGPTGPRNNLPIMLNRHPVSLQPKFTDELFEVGRLRERIEGTRLAVENQSKRHNPSSLAGELATPHPLIIRRSYDSLP